MTTKKGYALMRTTMTAAALLAAFVTSGYADDDRTETREGKPMLTIGAGMMYAPEYSGADEYESTFLPMISAEKEITPGNTIYLKGLTAGIDHAFDDKLTVGLLGNYRFEREADDSAKLSGMGDVDGAFEMGPKVRYQLNKQVGLEAQALADVSGAHDGWTARAGADYVMPLSEVTVLTVDGGLNYGSEDYTRTYYGVTGAQARPGRPAYSPDGGFSHVDAGVGVRHMLTRNVSVMGKVGADYLVGDAADSPLVENELQPRVTAGISYSF